MNVIFIVLLALLIFGGTLIVIWRITEPPHQSGGDDWPF